MASDDELRDSIIDTLRDISFRGRLLREYSMNSALGPIPINERDQIVLQIIKTIDPVTEGDIARLLGLSPSTVSELIKRLIDLEAVDKSERGEQDSRKKPLKLTEYGQQLVEAVRAYVVDAARYLTNGFKSEQLEAALGMFQEMQKNAVAEMDRKLLRPLPMPPRTRVPKG